MALLLNIDTATDKASVCISRDGDIVAYIENENQKEHASFIHKAIDDLLKGVAIPLKAIEAFAVTSGPGSYTGLRVGLATVKGFCYALSKPLILINTLEVMAKSGMREISYMTPGALLCPMIDAKRMEVFAGLYDQDLNVIISPLAVVPGTDFLSDYLENNKVFLFGSGSAKLKTVITHTNAVYADVHYSAKDLALLAEDAFQRKAFADVAYSEPEYFKAFYTTSKQNERK